MGKLTVTVTPLGKKEKEKNSTYGARFRLNLSFPNPTLEAKTMCVNHTSSMPVCQNKINNGFKMINSSKDKCKLCHY